MWKIPNEELDHTFSQLDTDNDGFISEEDSKTFLSQSGIPHGIVNKIWELAHRTENRKLDKKEFAIAMSLMVGYQYGDPLPADVPMALIESIYAPSPPQSPILQRFPAPQPAAPKDVFNEDDIFIRPAPGKSGEGVMKHEEAVAAWRKKNFGSIPDFNQDKRRSGILEDISFDPIQVFNVLNEDKVPQTGRPRSRRMEPSDLSQGSDDGMLAPVLNAKSSPSPPPLLKKKPQEPTRFLEKKYSSSRIMMCMEIEDFQKSIPKDEPLAPEEIKKAEAIYSKFFKKKSAFMVGLPSKMKKDIKRVLKGGKREAIPEVLDQAKSKTTKMLEHQMRGGLSMEKRSSYGPSFMDDSAPTAGWLHKARTKNSQYQRRWFTLSNGTIAYSKNPTDKNPLGTINLKNGYRVTEEKMSAEFSLIVALDQTGLKEREYFLRAGTHADKNKWMLAIKEEDLKTEEIPEDCVILDSPDRKSKRRSEIGRGGSGFVQLGQYNKLTVALKTLHVSQEDADPNQLNELYQEIKMLKELKHKHIVQMFGYTRKVGKLFLLIEYIEGGDLGQVLQRLSAPPSINIVLKIAKEITLGMIYLHSKDIIHRDLKPGNILLGNLETGVVKICDFGIAGRNNGEEKTFGTPVYAAPELPTDNHTNKVDVWSFAIIMWEVITKLSAWKDLKGFQIHDAIQRGDRPPLPRQHHLNDIIQLCWFLEAEARPSFSDVFTMLEELEDIEAEKTTGSWELKIQSAFPQDERLDWEVFSFTLRIAASTQIATVEILKDFLVSNDGFVYKQTWEKFSKHFSPIVVQSEYMVIPKFSQEGDVLAQRESFWTLGQVADVVSPTYFYGSLTSDEGASILTEKQTGAFLVRFSSTVGKFTLSVLHQSDAIRHIRISRNDQLEFQCEDSDTNKSYSALRDLISDLIISPMFIDGEPLKLTTPCNRHEDKSKMLP